MANVRLIASSRLQASATAPLLHRGFQQLRALMSSKGVGPAATAQCQASMCRMFPGHTIPVALPRPRHRHRAHHHHRHRIARPRVQTCFKRSQRAQEFHALNRRAPVSRLRVIMLQQRVWLRLLSRVLLLMTPFVPRRVPVSQTVQVRRQCPPSRMIVIPFIRVQLLRELLPNR